MKILIALILIFCTGTSYAETILKDGVTFTRTYTCPFTQGLEAGNKVKKEIAGQWIFIQKMKANTFIPAGGILPIQTLEDADLDGNTDFVIVRVDTWERIAKEKPIKATDSYLVEDSIDYE